MLSPVKLWRRQKEIRSILGKKGKVVTATTVFVPTPEFKKYAPYTVVLVDFGHGIKAFGQLADTHDDCRTGTRVVAVLRKTKEVMQEDVIAYGIKFRIIP